MTNMYVCMSVFICKCMYVCIPPTFLERVHELVAQVVHLLLHAHDEAVGLLLVASFAHIYIIKSERYLYC